MTDESPQGYSSLQQSLFEQLHELAENSLRRETPGHSLQPTLLVNDAVMKLLQQRNVNMNDRPQAIAVGAKIIRRLLIDYAKRRKALKRGGGQKVGNNVSIAVANRSNPIDMIELNDVLDALGKESPRVADVVELRFFGGMTGQEIADHLGIALATVNADWRFAKAWLAATLSDD